MDRMRLLERLSRGHLHNVDFRDFCGLVEAFDFRRLRTRGSHRAFGHPSVPRPLVLQPKGGNVKPYQVHQLLRLIDRYNLRMEDEP